MADFHEVQFPTTISRGSTSILERRTDIVTLTSGYEERNAIWADSRRTYDAGLGLRHLNDLYDVIGFWEARLGRVYGFRWKDWADFRSSPPNTELTRSDQNIGVGNGSQTKFQLQKQYTSGPTSYTRLITKPIDTSVVIDIDGSLVPSGNYTVDATTGVITFGSAPTSGQVIRAGFEFDIPVRFSEERLSINVELFNVGQVPQIDVTEVKVTLGELDT